MSRSAIAPAFRRPSPGLPRHRSRRYPLIRRNPRRFARGLAKLGAMPQPKEQLASSDLRLFAHTFGAAFLFVSVFIA